MNYILGIDASRCRSGGAIAHMKGILLNLDPQAFNIRYIHIWSYHKLLDELPDRPWLIKHAPSHLKHNLLIQLFWQIFLLSKEVKNVNCDILFTADASSLCFFQPQVVLSQDLLSYEPGVMRKYSLGSEWLRLLAILWVQNSAFRRAKGVIFLTKYASKVIQNSCGPLSNSAVISHGVEPEFSNSNRDILWPNPGERPIRCLYISNTLLYKHQWKVVQAIELLRTKGFDITLTLVGGGTGNPQKILDNQILKSDPKHQFIEQKEFVPQSEIQNYLSQADLFVFASSCETFGITLLESMAAGLPIACSDRSCLPELLEDGGIYFNPEDSMTIADAMEKIIKEPILRNKISIRAKQISTQYSWDRCSRETFSYIIETLKKSNRND